MEERIAAARLQLVGDARRGPGVDGQVFEAMLDGWRAQQLSRNLAFATIDAGARGLPCAVGQGHARFGAATAQRVDRDAVVGRHPHRVDR